jgi:4-hydroxybenzoate polyprenyltransferase
MSRAWRWKRWIFTLVMSFGATFVLLEILDDLPYEGGWFLLKVVGVIVVSIGVGELAERTYDQLFEPPPVKSKRGD